MLSLIIYYLCRKNCFSRNDFENTFSCVHYVMKYLLNISYVLHITAVYLIYIIKYSETTAWILSMSFKSG